MESNIQSTSMTQISLKNSHSVTKIMGFREERQRKRNAKSGRVLRERVVTRLLNYCPEYKQIVA
jgi:ribonuclease D